MKVTNSGSAENYKVGDIVELPSRFQGPNSYYIITKVHEEYYYVNLETGHLRSGNAHLSVHNLIVGVRPIRNVQHITLEE